MALTRHEAYAIGFAAMAGAGTAVAAVRWWNRRRPRPFPQGPGEDRVEELHLAFQDPTVPSADAPEETLHRYWSRLRPLDLTAERAEALPALPPE
ncbi:hypothetical protein ACIQVT_03035 [Streptomyces sp. NPDC100445]|uniref:hypothetical protein n=1 Tax=Streptomyces sp. NPDC100445 TaxID=3366102 RepID=UPI00382ECE39